MAEAFDWYEERLAGLGFEFLEQVALVQSRLNKTPSARRHIPQRKTGIGSQVPLQSLLLHRRKQGSSHRRGACQTSSGILAKEG